MSCLFSFYRIVTGNNTNNKSESDQEDNDDVNDNDWSYGAEKKGDVLALLNSVIFIPYCVCVCLWLLCVLINFVFSVIAKKRKSDKVLYFSSFLSCSFFYWKTEKAVVWICQQNVFSLLFRIQTHQEDPNHLSIRAVSEYLLVFFVFFCVS